MGEGGREGWEREGEREGAESMFVILFLLEGPCS